MKIKFLVFFFLLLNCKLLYSQEVKIQFKINNEIITNVDIKNETKYLIFLNPNLKKLDETKLNTIAENSLIREKIKEIELKKYIDLKQKFSFEPIFLNNLIKRKKLSNEIELEKVSKKMGTNLNYIKSKLKIEGLWSQFILDKYEKKIFINKEVLENKVKSEYAKSKKLKEFKLSELLIDFKDQNKIKEIKQSIIDIGFENTANLYSISESSKYGGDIGWIKESSLAPYILSELNNINIGEKTRVLKTSNGFLIIKINDIKEADVAFDIKKEIEDLFRFEKNKQLSIYSVIYYRRLKENVNINEY